MLEMIKLEPI